MHTHRFMYAYVRRLGVERSKLCQLPVNPNRKQPQPFKAPETLKDKPLPVNPKEN